jgi:hypothetical protein
VCLRQARLKHLPRKKHPSLFGLIVSDEEFFFLHLEADGDGPGLDFLRENVLLVQEENHRSLFYYYFILFSMP